MPIDPYFQVLGNLFIVPIIPYAMECTPYVIEAIHKISPKAVAVDLPYGYEKGCIQAAMRLPTPTLIKGASKALLADPTDPSFEALRSSLERGIDVFCVRSANEYKLAYPYPDPYAIKSIGLGRYYEAFPRRGGSEKTAKKLKELTLSYDSVLWFATLDVIDTTLQHFRQSSFSSEALEPHPCTLYHIEDVALREVMRECGWNALLYEQFRSDPNTPFPDRQKFLLKLFKEAQNKLAEKTDGYQTVNFKLLMKFLRNWSLQIGQLQPNLYQILTGAKACVDDVFGLMVYELATHYPFTQNLDNLPTCSPTIEEIWGNQKVIRFRPQKKGYKSALVQPHKKNYRFLPPGPFSICSYQLEDHVIENFGKFLKKKGTQIWQEEGQRTLPFSGSLEDGIDVRETIRHWPEKKLYVKTKGRPSKKVGSVVLIFDDDPKNTKYSWKTTWLGENDQESDMAFFATPLLQNVVGPGICRCEYGGFLMTYPPRRLLDVWSDQDYLSIEIKSEVLLIAAIDYSVEHLVVYCAEKPPRNIIKNYAARQGKKVVFLPMSQVSPLTRKKIRAFHVLAGRDTRDIADEFIL